jgi:hypothetical protein
MKNLLIVFIITAVCVFSGCSEKKKTVSDIDEYLTADSDSQIDVDEFEKTDVEPDETENTPDNDIEIEDIEIEDDEVTDDMETDDKTDEESDDDIVEPVPSVIYVKHDATGANNGLSWNNAFTSFHNALESSIAGDKIWVAYGKYYPESVHGLVTMDDVADAEEFNRYKHFRMKNGVEIYGGFAGTETELAQRDIDADETILSCDLGEVDDEYDNCFHIFYHPAGLDLDNSAVVDGFSMEGGYADDVEPHDAGSVMFNDGSSPVVRNGWIYWNYSYKGAVFYNKDNSMKVMDTTFVNNKAPYSKGGVFYNENSDIEISGCNFSNNSAEGDEYSMGGAVYNINSKITISETEFRNNRAMFGGAVYSESSETVIIDSVFNENKGLQGAAVYLKDSKGTDSFTGLSFTHNSTVSYGSNDGFGAAVRMVNSKLKIVNNLFYDNISGYGGAINSTATGENTSDLTIINSAFTKNYLTKHGAALYLAKTNANVANSVFNRNSTYSTAGTMGGAIYKGSGTLNVVNSIFKLNNAGLWKHIYDGSGETSVTYSCIVDSTVYPGTGNINTEPMMIEPDWSPFNFGLKPESPCIDTGSNTPFDAGNIAEGITKDMKGNDRIIKGKDESPSAIVDMGAVEFKPAP